VKVWNNEKLFAAERTAAPSASVPGPAQIIEPQKPDSTNARPDAQKVSIAWKVLEQEFIERLFSDEPPLEPRWRLYKRERAGK